VRKKILNSSRYDVIVVGGGLSGLTATVALSKCGLSVVLVDRDPAEKVRCADRDGRTTAIAAAGRAMLDALGVWSALANQAEPILDIRVSDGHSPYYLHYDHREVGEQPMGHIIENAHLKRVLMDTVDITPLVERRNGSEIEILEVGTGDVSVVLRDGARLTGCLLVGADGRASQVRNLAGIRATRLDYGQSSMVFTVAHEHPHRGVAHECFLPGGPLAFLPMCGDRSSVVWTEQTEVAKAFFELNDNDLADALSHRFSDILGVLSIEGRRWLYPLSLVHAEKQTAPRLALVGDAAHGIHPVAGQGFNLSLRDIAALAEEAVAAVRLGIDIGGPEVLRRYQTQRRFDTMTLVLATDAINRLFSNDIGPLRLLRSAGLAMVDRIPPLKQAFMRNAMGLMGDLPSMLRGHLP